MRQYVRHLASLFPLSFLHSHPTPISPLPGLNTAASLAPTTPSGSISPVAFRSPLPHFRPSPLVLKQKIRTTTHARRGQVGKRSFAAQRAFRSPRRGVRAAMVLQGARDESLVLPPTFVDAGRSDARLEGGEQVADGVLRRVCDPGVGSRGLGSPLEGGWNGGMMGCRSVAAGRDGGVARGRGRSR